MLSLTECVWEFSCPIWSCLSSCTSAKNRNVLWQLQTYREILGLYDELMHLWLLRWAHHTASCRLLHALHLTVTHNSKIQQVTEQISLSPIVLAAQTCMLLWSHSKLMSIHIKILLNWILCHKFRLWPCVIGDWFMGFQEVWRLALVETENLTLKMWQTERTTPGENQLIPNSQHTGCLSSYQVAVILELFFKRRNIHRFQPFFWALHAIIH